MTVQNSLVQVIFHQLLRIQGFFEEVFEKVLGIMNKVEELSSSLNPSQSFQVSAAAESSLTNHNHPRAK